jgi:glycosyltransferase involved in cell wall biosynthesis
MCSYLPGNIISKSSVIHHVAIGKNDVGIPSSSKFSLCYAGSVLPPRDVDVFFEGIKWFKQSLDAVESFDVRFLVDKPELVSNCARSKGIEDIIVIEPAVPYSQMPAILSRSHVLVIIEAPLKEGIFMASKIVDYVQIGRPIMSLSPRIGTNTDLLEKYGGGIAVDCQSPDSVLQALRTLFHHWKSGTLNRAYGSDRLFDHFSVQSVLKQYKSLFQAVQSKRVST